VPGYRVRNAVTIAGSPAQPTVEHVEPAR
jgi:hypothetical protein